MFREIIVQFPYTNYTNFTPNKSDTLLHEITCNEPETLINKGFQGTG